MNCEVLAVGTELLLGPNVDTNSTWIGEQLAANGIDSFVHTVVGDNHARIVAALKLALSRADAVVITGGLGPTQDDITREAISDVMGSPMILDEASLANVRAIFAERNRVMSVSNERQAWRPQASQIIEQRVGTAPGLICPIENKVIYALPGVPAEMKEMMTRAVIPDLRQRAQLGAIGPFIKSRFIRTFGVGESVIGEMVAPRLEALDAPGAPPVTIAFLAKGIEGIFVRITAKGDTADEAIALLDAEEAELRPLLGSLVFGVDDQSMEVVVGSLLLQNGLTLAVAESVTGGLIASRLTQVSGASGWFRGGVVSYASDVKYDVLHVPTGPVVTREAAAAMAEGVRTLLHADVAIAVTGVAGPDKQEDQPVGLVYGALALPNVETEVIELHSSGDRQRIRDTTCISLLDALRQKLLKNT